MGVDIAPVFVGFSQLLYDPSLMNYTSIAASLSVPCTKSTLRFSSPSKKINTLIWHYFCLKTISIQIKRACHFKLWPTLHCQFFLISQCTRSITLNNGPRLSLGLMAIYADQFPEAIPHLTKHAEMVREMALKTNSKTSIETAY
jgi:hypothetical protein